MTKHPGIFPVALVWVSLTAFNAAHAAQWIDLNATDATTGARYLVDRSSTVIDGSLIYVRVKRELIVRYGPPEGERQFRPCIDAFVACVNAGSSIHNFAIHCPSRSTAETGFTKYSEDGQPTTSHTEPRSKWDFTQAAPDTLADHLVKLACVRQKPAPKPPNQKKATIG